ncbi:hypothetical protein B0J12DRAFT_218438 [Macrophomina phaseolina]|uniref:Uncharacterized protein n=1 Tax=Macrophomina phaseolina TaxID=35725 RepID=A0ABQ8G160_9PEZI|nr:hypothetical protein B0J12DRAFT_218438 [Macrophomina phaseolina]
MPMAVWQSLAAAWLDSSWRRRTAAASEAIAGSGLSVGSIVGLPFWLEAFVWIIIQYRVYQPFKVAFVSCSRALDVIYLVEVVGHATATLLWKRIFQIGCSRPGFRMVGHVLCRDSQERPCPSNQFPALPPLMSDDRPFMVSIILFHLSLPQLRYLTASPSPPCSLSFMSGFNLPVARPDCSFEARPKSRAPFSSHLVAPRHI